MHELMFAISALVPKEKHLQDVKEAVEECILFPDDEEKENNLAMHITMLMICIQSKGSAKKALDLANSIKSKEKKLSLFETGEN